MVKTMSSMWLNEVYRGNYVPCVHIHDYSCEMNAFQRFLKVMDLAYKFYIPIHVLPALIFKWNRITKEPVKILKKAIFNIIRSSFFLSVYVSAFHYFVCLTQQYRIKTDKWNIICASFICSFAVLFEPSNRRTELALYMFPRFLESLHLALHKRGYVKSYNNAEVVIFAIAMSVIMYCYQNEEKNIKSTYLSMFKKFWGTN